MKIQNTLTCALLGLSLAACSGDGGSAETSTSDGTDGTTTMGTTTGSTSDATTDSDSATGSTSMGTTATTDATTGTTGDDPFVFDESPIDDYAQVDRVGMPAINTAVIASKDAYNQDNPEGDASGTYVPEIVASLEFLHGALDDDLTGLGLTPCIADDTCVTQAAPLVVPDTIKIDLTGSAGFPNGRALTDPVIDVTLAVILLDLSVAGQDATTFVGLLNPAANDVEFDASFPYLAAPT